MHQVFCEMAYVEYEFYGETFMTGSDPQQQQSQALKDNLDVIC